MKTIFILVYFVPKKVRRSINGSHIVNGIKNISSILDSLVLDGNDEVIIVIPEPITNDDANCVLFDFCLDLEKTGRVSKADYQTIGVPENGGSCHFIIGNADSLVEGAYLVSCSVSNRIL